MADFRISDEAAADLEEIFYFGAVQFGRSQAQRYLDGIRGAIARIATNPLSYQAVPDIRPGYRRSVY